MYCQSCGNKIRFRDAYCPRCQAPAPASVQMEIFDGENGLAVEDRTYSKGPAAKQKQLRPGKKETKSAEQQTVIKNRFGEEEMKSETEMKKLEHDQQMTQQRIMGLGRKLSAGAAVLTLLLAGVLIMHVLLVKQIRETGRILEEQGTQITALQTQVQDLQTKQDTVLQNSAQAESVTAPDDMQERIESISNGIEDVRERLGNLEQQNKNAANNEYQIYDMYGNMLYVFSPQEEGAVQEPEMAEGTDGYTEETESDSPAPARSGSYQGTAAGRGVSRQDGSGV